MDISLIQSVLFLFISRWIVSFCFLVFLNQTSQVPHSEGWPFFESKSQGSQQGFVQSKFGWLKMHENAPARYLESKFGCAWIYFLQMVHQEVSQFFGRTSSHGSILSNRSSTRILHRKTFGAEAFERCESGSLVLACYPSAALGQFPFETRHNGFATAAKPGGFGHLECVSEIGFLGVGVSMFSQGERMEVGWTSGDCQYLYVNMFRAQCLAKSLRSAISYEVGDDGTWFDFLQYCRGRLAKLAKRLGIASGFPGTGSWMWCGELE